MQDLHEQADALREKADRLDAQAAIGDRFEKYLDEFEENVVFLIKRQFEEGGIEYTYAAVRYHSAGLERWAISGDTHRRSVFSTGDFIAFLTDPRNTEVWVATEMERVLP